MARKLAELLASSVGEPVESLVPLKVQSLVQLWELPQAHWALLWEVLPEPFSEDWLALEPAVWQAQLLEKKLTIEY
ncbi:MULTISPECIES: hypothetical protein [Pseudomonas]|uniref:hypothetical protein n=1 Tax=Pseudomonas TaxID=286 RepID=UPI001AE4F847|nr:hypothetical protein [Pseudomonas ficuserectae]MBP1146756.1 hypothetical protein [Pseudomonas sp. PvP027]